ncbi:MULTISPECIES: diguanylate cyclase [unclassified Ruegeria]|uniref:diguanylate cyclase n=1 Tax=unclassified Ruegeria TaxID=2625375 RepID=UPI001490CA89|nr:MULTISPECIES: diguanylate cyclase [unclassified Ruegeria]NOD34818.1 diguanylate cyclase [Ruegeria sp. HKCCD7296]NOE41710.1 diguanylate cyclase [Ruegeria sp. HKCCD7319]
MSVQGTILVLDGVSTNRIMLKVQLTAAWYHVVQGEKIDGLLSLVRRTQPDLVLTAQTLPDGTAADVKKVIATVPGLEDVPVVAIAAQNDRDARLRALKDGLDDVLTHPFKDALLLARIRSLLRAHAIRQDLQVGTAAQPIGFGEPAPAIIRPPKSAKVSVLTHAVQTGVLWQKALSDQRQHTLSWHLQSNLQGFLSGAVPDAIVVELGPHPSDLNILADLRSRGVTRNTVLIGVLKDNDAVQASEALDRGADAVCLGGFCAQEIQLRLDNQIARKARLDHMRISLKKGLADSWVDPLTGLHNRRFAMRALDQIARESARTKRGFAVMLADLDHFKTINDDHGHASGDHVLTQAAERLRSALGPRGFVARIGGEEFMIGVPDVSPKQAVRLAETLCGSICSAPFQLSEQGPEVNVTVSIGLKMSPDAFPGRDSLTPHVETLIQSADKALYSAKKAGRNQVSIRQSAA